MSDTSESRGCFMPGLWAVGVLFVALKLSGHVDWSWVWVTCPFWVAPAVGIGITLLFLIALLLFTTFAMVAGCVVILIEQAAGALSRN